MKEQNMHSITFYEWWSEVRDRCELCGALIKRGKLVALIHYTNEPRKLYCRLCGLGCLASNYNLGGVTL